MTLVTTPRGWMPLLLALLLAPASLAARPRGPEGIYVLQGTDKPGNVDSGDLTLETIAGLSLRFSWAHLEPRPGVYNWTVLDAEIERVAALGKKVTIRPQAGAFAPGWLYEQGAASTFTDKGNLMPIPWDPVMLDAWRLLIAELGARYGRNRTVKAVHLSGPVADSAEMHLPDHLQDEPQAEELVLAAWTVTIDAYVRAFRRKPISLNLANPFSSRDGLAAEVADYLIAKARRRATLQMNSLSAKTRRTFNIFALVVDHGSLGRRVGFQMLSGSHKSRFGGSFARALRIAEDAQPRFLEIYQADIPNVLE